MSTISLQTGAQQGSVLTLDHMGINYVAPRITLDRLYGQQNSILGTLGAVTVRWPGGSDIESYSLQRDASGTVDLVRGSTATGDTTLSLAHLQSFFAKLALTGSAALIEIPSRWLVQTLTDANGDRKGAAATKAEALAGADEIHDFVVSVMELAQAAGVTVAGFEIGNEYQSYFSPEGYAGILNAVLPAVDAALTAVGDSSPQLIAQIAHNGNQSPPDAGLASLNTRMLNALEPATKSLVEAVTAHYYYAEGAVADGSATWLETYDNIDNWVAGFANLASAWGDVDLLFTEWGVSRAMPEAAADTDYALSADDRATLNFGLKALAPTLEIFAEMVQNGADSAQIWPSHNNPTALFNNSSAPGEPFRPDSTARPLGLLLDVMAGRLVGTQSIEVNTNGATSYDVQNFLRAGGAGALNGTAFVASRSATAQDLTLDLTQLNALSGGAFSVQIIEVLAGSTDGSFSTRGATYTGFTAAWEEPDSIGKLTNQSLTRAADGTITLHLDAYEVAVIAYEGFDQVLSSSTYYDSLAGSDDRILGTNAADYLRLGAGRDGPQAGSAMTKSSPQMAMIRSMAAPATTRSMAAMAMTSSLAMRATIPSSAAPAMIRSMAAQARITSRPAPAMTSCSAAMAQIGSMAARGKIRSPAAQARMCSCSKPPRPRPISTRSPIFRQSTIISGSSKAISPPSASARWPAPPLLPIPRVPPAVPRIG